MPTPAELELKAIATRLNEVEKVGFGTITIEIQNGKVVKIKSLKGETVEEILQSMKIKS